MYSHYKVPLFLTDDHNTYTVCRLCEEAKGVRFQENLYDGSRDKKEKVKCSPKKVPLIRDTSDIKLHR
jgi:hypothetical protein